MKEKRTNRQFREKENKMKQQKRKENLENSRQSQRRASKTFEIANPCESQTNEETSKNQKTGTQSRES